MKSAETKIPATAAKKQTPFFQKKSAGGFVGPEKKGSPFFQAKLTVGQPNDVYEKEADAVAEKVVQRKPIFESEAEGPEDGGIQRKCAGCEKEELQRKERSEVSPAVSQGFERSLRASKGGGTPLAASAREQMESSFGADLGNVRIHDNNSAAAMNKDLHAQAFTHGNDIYFSPGKYDASSQEGRRLLAHELTHTIQQGGVGMEKTGTQLSGLRRQPAIQRDDAKFEEDGIGAAITSGTMTADALTGKTFYAEPCRGIFGCRVGFTFDKAYKGKYYYAAADRDQKSIYVKISTTYDHNICGKCDSIRLIQVTRSTTKNAKGDVVSADPQNDTRKKRSGWDKADAPSRGWRVDNLIDQKDPYYDVTAGIDSEIGTPSKPAILWDAPGQWVDTKNAGGEFQTFLVCESPGKDRKTIAGINWGYYVDADGKINFSPVAVFCGPTQELKDAGKRWDQIEGNNPVNIDFADEAPVSHEGESTVIWFAFDSDKIRKDATIDSTIRYDIALQRIREHLIAAKVFSRIRINGFASSEGDPDHNLKLSKRRCEAIQKRLIADGIPAYMIEIRPHGADKGFKSLDLNRRVEIETTNIFK